VESKRPLPSPEGPDNLRSSLHFPPVGEAPGGRGTGLPVPMPGGTARGVGENWDGTGVAAMGTGTCVAVGAVPGGGTVVPGGVIGVGVSADGPFVSPAVSLGMTGFVACMEGGIPRSLGSTLPPFTSSLGVEGA